uniref:Uncharacterized protein n=1 Tax=Anguilla anguilla TaxID=7936 RepID=A0A0E9SA34_ANGAN
MWVKPEMFFLHKRHMLYQLPSAVTNGKTVDRVTSLKVTLGKQM